MSYSPDLRQRVVDFVRQGSSKTEAARLFQISRGRVYAWLELPPGQLAPKKPGPKGAHKLDLQKLDDAIRENPDVLQKELAQQFGVCKSAIHYGLKRLKISRTKKTFGYRERCPERRKQYLKLRERYQRRGYQLLYVDESGFEPDTCRLYGCTARSPGSRLTLWTAPPAYQPSSRAASGQTVFPLPIPGVLRHRPLQPVGVFRAMSSSDE